MAGGNEPAKKDDGPIRRHSGVATAAVVALLGAAIDLYQLHLHGGRFDTYIVAVLILAIGMGWAVRSPIQGHEDDQDQNSDRKNGD